MAHSKNKVITCGLSRKIGDSPVFHRRDGKNVSPSFNYCNYNTNKFYYNLNLF
jgi:hypothetical protein